MTHPFIFHGQSKDWFRVTNDTLTLKLAIEKGIELDKVLVRHEPDNEEYLVEMQPDGETHHLTFWTASITANSDQDLTRYAFKILMPQRQLWLDAKGLHTRMPPRETHFKFNSKHQPPAWVNKQVFYQIFPDRFCNGNSDISVKTGEYKVSGGTRNVVAKQWGEPVDVSNGNAGCEFYGGDLHGVEQKLDYLETLGITALYLNPIFAAPSNHKYDTSDYLNVDPHLGSNQHFAELCQQIHQRDMKIMLDAVFNHTSTEHPWFNLQGLHPEVGAYQGTHSEYRDYYLFEGESRHYEGWKGIKSLPVLNFENSRVRNYIYLGDDAVIKHWLKPPYSIDGWRFDVIHMLGEGQGAKNNQHYVKAFRQAAKSVNPDCYVLGEHFFEATQWLQGDQEDGAMNYYGFAHPLRALLANLDIAFDPISISVPEFLNWLSEARAKVPWLNQLSQLNQLDSHDTARFMELVKHDPRLFRLAATLLFSYVGTPCIYYGTELGIEGSHDPDNRRCMPWDEVEHNTYLPFIKQLIEIRKTQPALQEGDFVLLYQDDTSFAYARQLAGQCVIAAFNLGNNVKSLTLPVWKLNITNPTFFNAMTKQKVAVSNSKISIQLEPVSSILIESER
ncbi:maltodextrin glucosidase [Vibrio sp. RE88]|uniref:maltodextrin glucosidase n=1 Tax=Vibrio sp. RE88 TaxID=2607610 RepID=UPI00149394C0|nr:maltodextrin glucosidase [Vibrio sp. RE88]NOH62325.1 maltodextrin glucosidase [Vibrio sp. RE88]